MNSLVAKLYDRAMAATEEACLRQWRAELLERARGDVLEIGAGTGASIECYPGDVQSVTFCEPDPAMRKLLGAKLAQTSPAWDYRVMDASAEALPFDDDAFDSVFTSLVLCSVVNPDKALHELHRVTRRGGELLFLEHVAAERGSRRRLWQRAVNPLWKRVMGNCHLNRDTEAHISAHFELAEVSRESMRKAFPLVRPTIRGYAKS